MLIIRIQVSIPVAIALAVAPLLADDTDKENKGDGLGNQLAFMCLSESMLADEKALRGAMEKWLKPEKPEDLKLEVDAEKGQFSVTLGEQFVVGQLVPKPAPAEDIQYACRNALFWPESWKVLKDHKAHVIVFAGGKYEGRIERPLLLSRVIAGCSEVLPTAGVYWGDATVVHKPEFFRQLTPPRGVEEDAPGLLWIGYLRQSHDDKSLSLYTRGLSSFGCMDLEVVRSKRNPKELLSTVHDLAVYLIENGNVIRDGDTIGPDAATKIKTRYTKSAIERDGQVIRVEF